MKKKKGIFFFLLLFVFFWVYFFYSMKKILIFIFVLFKLIDNYFVYNIKYFNLLLNFKRFRCWWIKFWVNIIYNLVIFDILFIGDDIIINISWKYIRKYN